MVASRSCVRPVLRAGPAWSTGGTRPSTSRAAFNSAVRVATTKFGYRSGPGSRVGMTMRVFERIACSASSSPSQRSVRRLDHGATAVHSQGGAQAYQLRLDSGDVNGHKLELTAHAGRRQVGLEQGVVPSTAAGVRRRLGPALDGAGWRSSKARRSAYSSPSSRGTSTRKERRLARADRRSVRRAGRMLAAAPALFHPPRSGRDDVLPEASRSREVGLPVPGHRLAASFVLFGVGTGFGGLQDIILRSRRRGGRRRTTRASASQANPRDAQAWRDLATAPEPGRDRGSLQPLARYTDLRPNDIEAQREPAGLYIQQANLYRTRRRSRSSGSRRTCPDRRSSPPRPTSSARPSGPTRSRKRSRRGTTRLRRRPSRDSARPIGTPWSPTRRSPRRRPTTPPCSSSSRRPPRPRRHPDRDRRLQALRRAGAGGSDRRRRPREDQAARIPVG